MAESRKKNSIKNVIMGLSVQIVTALLTFVTRTIFIKILGEEYLGINGLFTNILAVLSLAELGIGTAIVYSMYQPIKENDTTKLTALVNYYKKLYNIIAIIVLVVGLLILPFLDIIVQLDKPIEHLHLYYVLFLLNSVISYICVYKTSITIATQKEYKLKVYNIIFSFLQFILQILVLLIFKNFALYLVVQIFTSLMCNIAKMKKSEKMFPFIKGKETLEKKDKISIWNNIKSLFLYQIGSVMLNNTDNILISILIGTVYVGYYSNYIMIITTITTFTSLIFTSLQASIGNLNVEASEKRKYFIFKVIDFMGFWIYGFCAICFAILFQDFISLWIGKEFLLTKAVMYTCVFNFYLQGVLYPIWCYRYTTGLFNHTKYAMLIVIIINIILSIILGNILGLFGILIATSIARLSTNMWFEPYKLFKEYFKKNVGKYYLTQLRNIIIVVILVILLNVICSQISLTNNILSFVIKCVLCVIVPNTVFFIIFRKTEEFDYLKQIVKSFYFKLKGKNET